MTALEQLLKAAKWIYDDADDRGEVLDDDGNEYPDFQALRKAIARAEREKAKPVRVTPISARRITIKKGA